MEGGPDEGAISCGGVFARRVNGFSQPRSRDRNNLEAPRVLPRCVLPRLSFGTTPLTRLLHHALAFACYRRGLAAGAADLEIPSQGTNTLSKQRPGTSTFTLLFPGTPGIRLQILFNLIEI